PLEDLLERPASRMPGAKAARHPHIPLPDELYAPARRNSRGIEFGEAAAVRKLLSEIAGSAPSNPVANPLVNGTELQDRRRNVISPIDGSMVGTVVEADE